MVRGFAGGSGCPNVGLGAGAAGRFWIGGAGLTGWRWMTGTSSHGGLVSSKRSPAWRGDVGGTADLAGGIVELTGDLAGGGGVVANLVDGGAGTRGGAGAVGCRNTLGRTGAGGVADGFTGMFTPRCRKNSETFSTEL